MKKIIVLLLLAMLAGTAAKVASLRAATVTYTYDEAGRLSRVDYGDEGAIAYTYDLNGNLLERAVSAEIFMADVIAALQVLAGLNPVQPVFQGADINDDDRVGLEEVLALLRNLAQLR